MASRTHTSPELSARQRFTFQGNLKDTRHGWLRLTPAYSVHLVRERLTALDPERGPLLDPFSGTGTTLLACAEHGLPGDAVDLNPFLVWLARAKLARYPASARDQARLLVAGMARAARARSPARPWVPPLHRIERWWEPETLAALGRAFGALGKSEATPRARDLAKLAFCRTLIECANVSFGHQSMSFKRGEAAPGGRQRVALALEQALESILPAAAQSLGRATRRVVLGDSRRLGSALRRATLWRHHHVAALPEPHELHPRASAVHVLARLPGRPEERRRARLASYRWNLGRGDEPTFHVASDARTILPALAPIADEIAEQSPVLGAYVRRYFHDMAEHVDGLGARLAPGGTLAYVVGNSKFYDTLLPAERLFAGAVRACGLRRRWRRDAAQAHVEARALRVLRHGDPALRPGACPGSATRPAR